MPSAKKSGEKSSTAKKIPKSEIVWTRYKNSSEREIFVMTSNSARDCYYLYEVSDDGFVKLGKGKSPPELEKKYSISDRMKKDV